MDSRVLSRAAAIWRNDAERRWPAAICRSAEQSSLRCDGVRRRFREGRRCGAMERGRAIRFMFRAARASLGSAHPSRGWISATSLRGPATACMDLSDGLSLDLHRLCVARASPRKSIACR